MRDSGENRRGSAERGLWWLLARVIVWLRFPIVAVWIAAAVAATIYLPSLSEAETGELGNLLPTSSEPLQVEEHSLRTFGLPLLSHSLVVASEPRGFSKQQLLAVGRYIRHVDTEPESIYTLRTLPLLNVPKMAPAHPNTAIAAFVYTHPALSEGEREETTRRFANRLAHASGAPSVNITGSVPAATSQANIAYEWLNWIELATVLVVVGVLVLYFRAIGIPLLGLAAVGIAYVTATHALAWLSPRYNLSVPQEVNPVIVALLFGTLTDYVVFFVSGYRRRIGEGQPSRDAVTRVTAELLPVILTAGLMIAGATLTLLLSGVRFLSAFGPGLAVAVLFGVCVAVTFVPSVLGIFGPRLLWPRCPDPEAPPRDAGGARGWLVGLSANHPVIVAVACTLLLAVGAYSIHDLALGNPLLRGLPVSSSPRAGYETASDAFGPGIVGPTMLVVEGSQVGSQRSQLGTLQSGLEGIPGVRTVIGPVDWQLQQQYGLLISPDGSSARFILVLNADPNGAAGIAILDRVRERLPDLIASSGLSGVHTGLAGDTAIAAELKASTRQAFIRVAPAAVLVLFLLLWVLLRSWTAPLYLVGVSALVVLAALGLTVYVFQDLAGYGELVFFVPIAGTILLLSLGSDYNVFLISRIWREAGRRKLRPAIQTAGARAGRAITVAGMILALSFAAVALVPILAFRELAFMMAVGLILDTVIARTFLIPALVSLFGHRAKSKESRSLAAQEG